MNGLSCSTLVRVRSQSLDPQHIGSDMLHLERHIPVEVVPSGRRNVDVTGELERDDFHQMASQVVSHEEWIREHSLKKKKLDLQSILAKIGFRYMLDYDQKLKKSISSKYGDGLFTRVMRSDGKTYNLTCSKAQVEEIASQLANMITLYKRRLQWLTSGTRRICGVILERSIVFVLDCHTQCNMILDQYRQTIVKILEEQVAKKVKFNIIRSAADMDVFRSQTVPVSAANIREAIEWMWRWDRTKAASPTCTCEAVMRAMQDLSADCVYLITEGSSCNGSREILFKKLNDRAVACLPLNTVALNVDDCETVKFLRDVAQLTDGRFHAYSTILTREEYAKGPIDECPTRVTIAHKLKTFGGMPPGAGTRPDVIGVFSEMEEARNALEQIQQIILEIGEPAAGAVEPVTPKRPRERELCELSMSSQQWLQRYGLKPLKLEIFDALGSFAFRHADGVVGILEPHCDHHAGASKRDKLVNAKYCELFPTIIWNDGDIRHVQVSPELHRNYEKLMVAAIQRFERRLNWLQLGSRELFGTIMEDCIYILIDTSSSMELSLRFVKEKLLILLKEQVLRKRKFNLVAFNTSVFPWKDRLVDVNDYNVASAVGWINQLACAGSTNTLGAIRFALADMQTDAIYLLSDGRPNQPPRTILACVNVQVKIPIHTISFNCTDADANEFLFNLARETGARYHQYREPGHPTAGPEPYESEDVRLIKDELKRACDYLQKVAQLRDECAVLSWVRDEEARTYKTKRGIGSSYHESCRQLRDASEPATNSRAQSATHRNRVMRGLHEAKQRRPMSASAANNRFGETRSSLLRKMSSSGRLVEDQGQWMLPETKQLIQKQWAKEKDVIDAIHGIDDEEEEKKKKKKKKVSPSSANLSPQKWLELNGIDARRLHLFDAVGSVAIPHKPVYVPIIDKTVQSKVWDSVFHMTFVTPDGEKIINPRVQDLEPYIVRLKGAINALNIYLDELVWKSLSREEKEKFRHVPPRCIEEKKDVRKALHRDGWPVTEKVLVMFEEEIERAVRYLHEAEKTLDLAKSGPVSPKKEEKKPEPKKKKEQADPKKQEQPQVSAKAPKATSYVDSLRNQKVIAMRKSDGFYCAGVVVKTTDHKHAIVDFYDGSHQKTTSNYIILVGGATSRPKLRPGDYVLARKIRNASHEIYVPGVLLTDTLDESSDLKHYTVLLYDETSLTVLRKDLIKISKSRFALTCKAIREGRKGKAAYASDDENRDSDGDKRKKRRVRSASPENRTGSRHSRASSSGSSKSDDSGDDKKRRRPHSGSSSSRASSKASSKRHSSRDTKGSGEKKSKGKHSRIENGRSHRRAAKHFAKQQQKLEQFLVQIKQTLKERNKKQEELKDAHEENKEIPTPRNGSSHKRVAEWRLELRRALPVVREDTTALARFPDEGWYYSATVLRRDKNESYLIKDSIGDLAAVHREDIITFNTNHGVEFKKGDHVIAQHPHFAYSYAPGIVQEDDEDTVVVRFYDDVKERVTRTDVFQIDAKKYEADVEHIQTCADDMVGRVVIARNDEDGVFMLAVVKSRVGKGSEFMLSWADGTETKQKSSHIFGERQFARRHAIKNGDKVLAITDKQSCLLLPGEVCDNSTRDGLEVAFCDEITHLVPENQCFWISPEYYNNAAQYFSDKNDGGGGGGGGGDRSSGSSSGDDSESNSGSGDD